MTVPRAACDDEIMPTVSGGQRWLVSWHPAAAAPAGHNHGARGAAAPAGRNHGAAGICVGNDGRDLVLISPDRTHWGFPAGRPEGAETLAETLAREMREEACVEVLDARLLGFARSECVEGHERGLVLVRSYWLAEVAIGPWKPQFEIEHRKVVPAVEATTHVRDPEAVATRISMRALAEAGLAGQHRSGVDKPPVDLASARRAAMVLTASATEEQTEIGEGRR
jgi:8-oxo-dGTP pyrophosphatase MutT (NUDIX family)